MGKNENTKNVKLVNAVKFHLMALPVFGALGIILYYVYFLQRGGDLVSQIVSGAVMLLATFMLLSPLQSVLAGLVAYWAGDYRVGDWVTINGTRGQVLSFNPFRTVIKTPQLDIVPFQSTNIDGVINHSKEPLATVLHTYSIANFGDYVRADGTTDLVTFSADMVKVAQDAQDHLTGGHRVNDVKCYFTSDSDAREFTIRFRRLDEQPEAKAIDALLIRVHHYMETRGVIFGSDTGIVFSEFAEMVAAVKGALNG